MAQIDPIGQYNRVAYFYAPGVLEDLGMFSKEANAAVLCRIDYSQTIPPLPGPPECDFGVDVGSNPPLAITSANFDAGTSCLDFIVSGGVEGQSYELTITVRPPSQPYTTIIHFNVPFSAECGAPSTGVNSAAYPTGVGMMFINSAPKYTVAPSPPSGPNIKDQWYNINSGNLFEYITDGISYWWQQITPATTLRAVQFQTVKLQPVVPNGLQSQFTLLTVDETSPNIIVSTDLLVSVDDVIQEPDTDFVAYADQIKFTTIPSIDSIVFMTWFAHY